MSSTWRTSLLVPATLGSRRAQLAADAVVVLAAVVTFARAVPYGLLLSWDDDRFVVTSPVAHEISWRTLVSTFTQPHFEAWHPLHLMSYWLDVPWVGANGPVLHATSLALWALALLAVRRAMSALGLPLAIAAIATLAYGLHPIHVEVVTWATGRKDILAALFCALAIVQHVRAETDSGRAIWLARGLFVLAALSKTTTLALPLVLVLIDTVLRGMPIPRALRRQLPTLAIAAALGVVVLAIWHGNAMMRVDAAGGTSTGSVLLVMDTFTHQLRTAVLPIDNAAVYAVHRTADFGWTVCIGPAVLVATLLVAWRWRARRLLFVALAFIAFMLPVANVVPMYWHYMDRYLSLPLLPLTYGVGAALVALMQSRGAAHARPIAAWRSRAPMLAAVVLVVALALRTMSHQMVYTSDAALWLHATRVQPRAFYAWVKLGEVRRDHGNLRGAIDAYEHAVVLEPRLRLSRGALFYAVALRDEARGTVAHPDAHELTRRYHATLDQPTTLRMLASEMVTAGYREAALLPLGRALDLEPVPDGRLETAAHTQLDLGRPWLARFYISRMSEPPANPTLRALSPRT